MYYSQYDGFSGYGYPREFGKIEKKKAKRSFSGIFLSLSVYLLISYAVIYIAQFLTVFSLGAQKAEALFENPYYIFALQVLAMYLIAFPIFLLLTRRLDRMNNYEGTLRCGEKMTLGEFVAAFFVCSAVMTFGAVISNIFTEFLSGILGHTVENSTSELISDSPLWLIIIVAVIIGPIVEELIFRKVLIDVMGVYGIRLAIIISSVAFGIFHGNFSQALYATLLGFILGYIYAKTRKVRYSVFMHILVNFFGTVPTLLVSDSLERILSMGEDISDAAALNFLGDIMNVYGLFILQYGFAIAGIIVFIYCTSKRLYLIPSECQIRIPTTCIARTTVINLGVIMFLILSAGQFILSLM